MNASRRPQDTEELRDSGALAGRVLECVDAHHRGGRVVGKAGVLEGAQIETGASREAHLTCACSCSRKPGGRGIDASQRRARLRRHPQAGAARAAGEVRQHIVRTDLQPLAHSLRLGNRQEADMRELRRKVVLVGVRPPQPIERLAPGQGVVDGVIPVKDSLEDASLRDFAGQ